MMRAVGYAMVFILVSMSEIAAQTPSLSTADTPGREAGRTFIVLDDSGTETKGKLVRFTPEALTLAVKGHEVVFDHRKVTAVFERGDSLKNGMIFGILPGAIALATAGDDDLAQAGSIVVMAIGLGAGVAIDALIQGRHLVYGSPTRGDQTAGAGDFATLLSGRSVIVVDNAGTEARGRMVRLTDEALTITVDGRDRTIAAQKVAAIFERGDSVKNGLRNGFLAGAAIGMAAGVSKTRCGRDPLGIGIIQAFTRYEPCTAGERITQGVGEGTLLGLLGAGLGGAVDKLIPGRRLVYEKAGREHAPAIALLPSLAPSRTSLHVRMTW